MNVIVQMDRYIKMYRKLLIERRFRSRVVEDRMDWLNLLYLTRREIWEFIKNNIYGDDYEVPRDVSTFVAVLDTIVFMSPREVAELSPEYAASLFLNWIEQSHKAALQKVGYVSYDAHVFLNCATILLFGFAVVKPSYYNPILEYRKLMVANLNRNVPKTFLKKWLEAEK